MAIWFPSTERKRTGFLHTHLPAGAGLFYLWWTPMKIWLGRSIWIAAPSIYVEDSTYTAGVSAGAGRNFDKGILSTTGCLHTMMFTTSLRFL